MFLRDPDPCFSIDHLQTDDPGGRHGPHGTRTRNADRRSKRTMTEVHDDLKSDVLETRSAQQIYVTASI